MALAINFLSIFLKETLLDVLLFPVWWYSRGLLLMLRHLGVSVRRREHALGLRLWIASIAKPMYGQRDWQGRLISFIFRLLILVFRLAMFAVWIVLCCAVLLAYLLVLPIAVFGIFRFYS